MARKIAVTIHGVMTRGRWQKELTPVLASHGVIPYPLDYGFLDLLRLLIPGVRTQRVNWFMKTVSSIVEKEKVERVSIIAHSFGSYMALEALRRYRGSVPYDRVVLTGCIVSPQFDWAHVFAKNRCVLVRNEIATKDRVVSLAKLIMPRTGGPSGRSGFAQSHRRLIETRYEIGHSDTHFPSLYETWARMIAFPQLDEQTTESVRQLLEMVQQIAAKHFAVDRAELRANVFVEDGGELVIPQGAHANMLYAPELGVRLRPGEGCTGKAFQDREIFMGERLGDTWQGGPMPAGELEKVDPNLSWVLSTPVYFPGSDEPAAVLNLSGIGATPQLVKDLESDAFEAYLREVAPFAETLGVLLFRPRHGKDHE